jgi:uncharacterized protein
MDRNDLLNKIYRTLHEIDPEVEVVLFGSRARGDYGKESDWDILILTGNNISKPLKQKIRDAIFNIELESGEPISILIYSKKEWEYLEVTPLYQNIKKEGVKL